MPARSERNIIEKSSHDLLLKRMLDKEGVTISLFSGLRKKYVFKTFNQLNGFKLFYSDTCAVVIDTERNVAHFADEFRCKGISLMQTSDNCIYQYQSLSRIVMNPMNVNLFIAKDRSSTKEMIKKVFNCVGINPWMVIEVTKKSNKKCKILVKVPVEDTEIIVIPIIFNNGFIAIYPKNGKGFLCQRDEKKELQSLNNTDNSVILFD